MRSVTQTGRRKPLPPSRGIRLKGLVSPPEPVPQLPRPVLVIPGGRSRRIGLPAVLHYLTVDGNNSFGGTVQKGHEQDLREVHDHYGGNVFCLKFSERFGTCERNADEIAEAVETLKDLTGADTIDIVAECKGALEVRAALQKGLEVGNVVESANPRHGLPLTGDLGAFLGNLWKVTGWPTHSGDIPLNPESAEALKGFRTDLSLGGWHWNPVLEALNTPEGRRQELENSKSLTSLNGDGLGLMAHWGLDLPLPVLRGDSMVPPWSSFAAGATHFEFRGNQAQHGMLHGHPEALAKMAETLATDGHPSRDENYYEKPTIGTGQAALRSALWVGSMAGRVNALVVGLGFFGGGLPAAVATGLAAVTAGQSLVDSGFHLRDAFQGRESLVRSSLGILGKTAQSGPGSRPYSRRPHSGGRVDPGWLRSVGLGLERASLAKARLGASSEEDATQTDHGGPFFDGDQVVVTHPHRQLLPGPKRVISLDNLFEQLS